MDARKKRDEGGVKDVLVMVFILILVILLVVFITQWLEVG